jgi:hypothetical protein
VCRPELIAEGVLRRSSAQWTLAKRFGARRPKAWISAWAPNCVVAKGKRG